MRGLRLVVALVSVGSSGALVLPAAAAIRPAPTAAVVALPAITTPARARQSAWCSRAPHRLCLPQDASPAAAPFSPNAAPQNGRACMRGVDREAAMRPDMPALEVAP
ncbi:hypothetical protein AB4Z37_07985 [Bradyrhizobium sp. 2TAF24]